MRRRACFAFLTACCLLPGMARGQVFISNSGSGGYASGSIGAYDASTGLAVNAPLVPSSSGLFFPVGLAFANGNLYVADDNNNRIAVFNASTGAMVNADFITGLVNPTGLTYPNGLTVSGNSLFSSENLSNVVLQYDATTGRSSTAAL